MASHSGRINVLYPVQRAKIERVGLLNDFSLSIIRLPTQLTVPTPPFKAQPPPSAATHSMAPRGSYCGAHSTRVSSRLFPDASTRPYCPEALFLFFSRKLSLPLCAQLIAQHNEDQSAAVSDAKTSLHRAKEADSFTYHHLLVDLSVVFLESWSYLRSQDTSTIVVELSSQAPCSHPTSWRPGASAAQ